MSFLGSACGVFACAEIFPTESVREANGCDDRHKVHKALLGHQGEAETPIMSSFDRSKAAPSTPARTPKRNAISPEQGRTTPNSRQRLNHRATITLVHSKTLSLHKTVLKYPRKHRDLSGVLSEAVEALEEFKDVDWPPKRSEMAPDWRQNDGKDICDEAGTAEDVTKPSVACDGDSSAQTRIASNIGSSANTPPMPRVDAAAMEPMHPAVITTLHALCMVISSESKTPKMTEISLECITILTNGRYVSGIAGGRMKLDMQRKLSETEDGTNGGSKRAKSAIAKAGHDGRDGGLSFLGYVVESVTRAADSSSDAVQTGMAKTLLAIMTCPKCGVHEAAMLQAVRSTFHIYLVGKSFNGKELAKKTLVDMLKCVFNRMEAYDVVNKTEGVEEGQQMTAVGEETEDNGNPSTHEVKRDEQSDASKSEDDTVTTSATSTSDAASSATNEASVGGRFASQYHTDSYLLFRALCKLSSKTLPGDENVTQQQPTFFNPSTPAIDPLALNSKILSLELILAVFEHCGPAFQNGEKFVYAVQSYLCVSLLKNCMSHQTKVAQLSLKIFLLLVSLTAG